MEAFIQKAFGRFPTLSFIYAKVNNLGSLSSSDLTIYQEKSKVHFFFNLKFFFQDYLLLLREENKSINENITYFSGRK